MEETKTKAKMQKQISYLAGLLNDKNEKMKQTAMAETKTKAKMQKQISYLIGLVNTKNEKISLETKEKAKM